MIGATSKGYYNNQENKPFNYMIVWFKMKWIGILNWMWFSHKIQQEYKCFPLFKNINKILQCHIYYVLNKLIIVFFIKKKIKHHLKNNLQSFRYLIHSRIFEKKRIKINYDTLNGVLNSDTPVSLIACLKASHTRNIR